MINPETGEEFEFIPGVGLIPSDTNNQENGQLPPPSIFFVKDTPQEVPLGSAKQQDGEDIPLGFHQKNLQPQPDSKPDSNTGAPTQTLPAVSTRAHGFQPLRVTEYMVRNMVPGMGTFPQWIELYNPNSVDINIAGWHLTTVSFKNGVKFLTTLTINNWGNIQ